MKVTTVDVSAEPPFAGAWNDYLSADVGDAIRSHKPGYTLDQLTTVQRAVLRVPPGQHVYAIAPTGAGKLLAAIAPILEGMLHGRTRAALVLANTNALLDQHVKEVVAPVAARMGPAAPRIVRATKTSRLPDSGIVFATPSTVLKIAPPEWLAALDVVVLDEVDSIAIDPGFAKDVGKILDGSRRARLMTFTATHTEPTLARVKELLAHSQLQEMVHIIAGAVHRTHVDHVAMVVQAADLFVVLAHVLAGQTQRPGHKVLVFFNTAMFAELAYEFISMTTTLRLIRMHSRMSKSAIKRSQTDFTKCSECFMMSSDMSARGMDFEAVDCVIQVGHVQPDIYMQRVGRTGRGTRAAGSAIVLLTPREIKGTLAALEAKRDVRPDVVTPEFETRPAKCGLPSSARAFKAYLGYYSGNLKAIGMTPRDMVAEGSAIIGGLGCPVPSLEAKLAKKLRLTVADGITIS